MEEEKNIVTDARTCFLGSDAGKRVLAAMMIQAGFFKHNHTPEEQAVENFMKMILSWTGSYPTKDKSSKERVDKFVATLSTMEIEY